MDTIVERLWYWRDVAKLTGEHERMLWAWIERGVLKPQTRRRKQRMGRPRQHYLSLGGVLAIMALATLRKRGVGLQSLKPLAHYCCDLSADEIRRAAAADMVLVYGGPDLPPRLMSREAHVRNCLGYTVWLLALDMRGAVAAIDKGLAILSQPELLGGANGSEE